MRLPALLASVIVLCCAASASAAGLSLVPIPGPGGSVPFVSPGGFGPVFVASPPGDRHRVFVGTKDGYIYVIDDGVLQPAPFLDLHTKVGSYNLGGMFSIAFDPGYATNRRFYVDYADTADHSAKPNLENFHLDAFQTSASNPDLADPASETQILEIPSTNCAGETTSHYGGQLQFGPDGHLWISTGDGGDGCNDDYNATRLNNLYGKLLRIDPQPTQAPDANGNRYSIPADNPLVGRSGVRAEIWAYGLRNPWRFSFDPASGDLLIADVGGSQQEELDRISSRLPAGAPPPFFGWPCVEGTITLDPNCPVSQTPVAPLFTFNHGIDATATPYCTALIGGVVLNDPSLGGDYAGRYLYGYFCAARPPDLSGELLSSDLVNSPTTARDEGTGVGQGLSSFGVDACGHAYVTNVYGGLWRVEGATPGPCGEYQAPPPVTLSSPPSAIVHASAVSVAFLAPALRGTTVECSLDGAAAAPCSSPASFPSLPDGPHTLAITVHDEAGNTSTATTASFIIDSAPPHTTITSAPPRRNHARSVSVTFSASESDVTFACSLDGAPATACSSPASFADLVYGSHTLSVTATDAAGNVEATPARAGWVTSRPPLPAVALLLAPPRTLTVGADRRLRVTLRASSASAQGTLTLMLGSRTLARDARVRVIAGRATTVVLLLPRSLWSELKQGKALNARLVLVLRGAGGRRTRGSRSVVLRRRTAAAPRRRGGSFGGSSRQPRREKRAPISS